MKKMADFRPIGLAGDQNTGAYKTLSTDFA